MKFRCVKSSKKGSVTLGKHYAGQITLNRYDEINIVIYNNEGKWKTYPPELFAPMESK